MKTTRTFLSAGAALTLVLCLVACGSNAPSQEQAKQVAAALEGLATDPVALVSSKASAEARDQVAQLFVPGSKVSPDVGSWAPDGPDKGTMVVTVEPPDQDPQIITVIVEYEDSTWKITEIVPDEPPASPSDPPETLPTDEEVLARLKEAKGIPDKWVCGDFDVDYEDTATLDDWVVYRVKDDRIKTLADFQDLAKPYFSERGIASMVRVFVLTDIDGRLYTGTDPNGCEGGPVDEQFTVQKHSDNRFDITIVSTFDGGGEPWAETTHVCYLWENGMWVFDDACDLAVDIVGTTWTNDSTEWASDYELNFGTDGLVTRVGYRNRDTGKYRVIDQSKIIASYDDNYWDSPGEGFVNSGSRYEETYIYGAANNTLSATTSGDDNSNAPDSIWYGFPGITHYFWW